MGSKLSSSVSTSKRVSQTLSHYLQVAIEKAQSSGALAQFDIPSITVTRTKQAEHGDYQSNVALQLQRMAGTSPHAVAEAVVKHVPMSDLVGTVEIAGPGFINIRLAETWLQAQIDEILALGDAVGNQHDFIGRQAQIECVSANPTGPITVGRIRGGVIGDTLARLMRACGYSVTLEYYFNNAGRQMRLLGESLRARYLERLGREPVFPADGYKGEYLYEIADQLIDEQGDALADVSDWQPFKEFAEARIFSMIRQSLERIRIKHDTFFNENSLYEDGSVDWVVNELRQRGLAYEKDGATWFKATEFGIEKDKVLIKESGEPTYRTPDIAYHVNKLDRGFHPAINILGADHAEEAKEVAAGLAAIGRDSSRIHVILHQFVTLSESGISKRMSTREGEFVTLDALVDDVGADAVRFFILSRGPGQTIDFDLDLAKRQSNENPVYYIQNAHVRCVSMARVAQDRGLDYSNGDVRLLKEPEALALIRRMVEFPEVVYEAVATMEPHRIAFWAHQELASQLHATYEVLRAMHTDVPEDIAKARLKLYEAIRLVLRRALDLMGMSAPESM